MGAYTVGVSSKSQYHDGLTRLWLGVTDAGWPRCTKHGSQAHHDVTVTDGSASVDLILRERDLYLVGVRRQHERLFFEGEVDPNATGRVVSLGIAGNYLELVGTCRASQWGRAEIVRAISAVGAIEGSSSRSLQVRSSLAILITVISEAMRFEDVFGAMKRVVSGHERVSFDRYASLVRAWAEMSKLTARTGAARHETLSKLKTRLVTGSAASSRH